MASKTSSRSKLSSDKNKSSINDNNSNISSTNNNSNNNNNNNNNSNNNDSVVRTKDNEFLNKLIKSGDAIKYMYELVNENEPIRVSTSSSSLSLQDEPTDLLNHPQKLEVYFTSLVDVLVDLKKHLSNTVKTELKRTSGVDIMSLRNDVLALDEQKNATIKAVNQPVEGVIAKVQSNVNYDQQLKQRLQSIDETLGVLDYFERYHSLSSHYTLAYDQHNYMEATRLLLEMESTQKHLPEHLMNNHPFPRIIPTLHDQFKKRKNNLKTLLLDHFTNAVMINRSEVVLNTNSHELIQSLKKLGLLNSVITSVSAQLFNILVSPFLKATKVSLQSTHSLQCGTTTNGNKMHFLIDPLLDNKQSVSIESIYHVLQDLFTFIYKHLFGSEKELMEKVGDEIWCDTQSIIEQSSLRSLVPSDATHLPLFQSIQKHTKEFESHMADIEKKRDHLLYCAREIIVKDKLIFKSVNSLFLLCDKALAESNKASPLCSKKIFQGCRDVFDLFRIMYLKYHKAKLVVPLMACLYYNSCLFLARCLLIPYELRLGVQQQDNKTLFTFVDYAPLFTTHSKEFFKKYLGDQMASILAYYDQCNELDNTKEDSVMSNTELNFKRMVNEITKLSSTWKLVFPREDYFGLIAHFVDRILSTFIELVLKLENISSLETSRLSQLCSLFLSFEQLFLYQGESEDLAKDRVKLVHSWKKFWQLNKVLDVTLAEIVAMYNKKQLKRLSNKELELLVRSIFAEFDLRTTFLKTLASNRVNQ
ncbi:hypothetical protein SAMD00019534_019440 [Acytostelium subglobosum LB1]|uniref:hypothetical protein n=1 Tax=Acytostelium subglobosum LB1 TaxID=1410327 RepID=UPI0006451911|nr:hypothetical protein SAMD00019534_019440 [Acytostelium subglobosum LB1]GAM18769.1 hypothetical protein SAMD00019534_019440 [Acytostelium subglobosum LB1]|eukprot:XP_012757989.1 hypothetical protein SAMD00019534_019440 [Acytostelium subglobosum LB1]